MTMKKDKKVYCSNCIYIYILRGDLSDFVCRHKSNIGNEQINDDWYSVEYNTVYLKTPEELNKDNNCNIFIDRMGEKK